MENGTREGDLREQAKRDAAAKERVEEYKRTGKLQIPVGQGKTRTIKRKKS